MTHSKIQKKYQQACRLVVRRRLADAMVLLRQMVSDTGKEYLGERIDALQDNYEQLLKHSFSGVEDPERENVYRYLMRSLLELADQLQELGQLDTAGGMVYQLKRELLRRKSLEHAEARQLLDELSFGDELSDLLKSAKVESGGDSAGRQKSLVSLFQIAWLAGKYTDQEISLLEEVCDSGALPWHDKALIVSALTLSLLAHFDISKCTLLFRFVEAQQSRVWERALIGLFLGLLRHNERFALYPVLEEKTRELLSIGDMEQYIEAILVQYIKSRETHQVKKKWEEEILPAMMKMRPKIEEKLDLDNIFTDPAEEGKNPDWETFFEDSPDLLDKLQELTEMQMDGMDVFISAFARLKHFPFFREFSHWFMPFFAANPAIVTAIRGEGGGPDLGPLIEKLEKTYFMCNSDKYSFSLNLAMVPDQQKSAMMNMLNAEMENLSEVEKDMDLPGGMARTKSSFTQYFQDLYRFYKLHPWRAEFTDVFDLSLDLHDTGFLKHLMPGGKTIRNIGEFLFDKQFYEDALKVFTSILERDTSNIELFEKIAYCHEKTGDLEAAFTYYQKAELIDTGREWIIRKLAWCCRYLNRWEEALAYYRQLEKMEPDDLHVQAHIGQCLIHLRRYGEALDYYFKVEVLAPENEKIRRPLAWCSFLTGKFDTARDYLERLLANEPSSPHDLMNLGHVLWCLGKANEARQAYRDSVMAWKSIREFTQAYNEDRKHLRAHGIVELDMDLMLDYLKLEVRALRGK